MTILVERTAVVRGYRERLPLRRFDALADARAWVRDEYHGCKSEGAIYVDTNSRGTIRTGTLYRRVGEGVHWVSFSRVLSETEHTAESVDLQAETA